MGLKQIEAPDRIIFLKEFIGEVFLNSIEDEQIKKRIEAERIKQKLMPKKADFEKTAKPLLPLMKYSKSQYTSSPSMTPGKIQPTPIELQQVNQKITPVQKPIASKPVPKGAGIKKIIPLVKDSALQSIECTGPGKNIVVKKYNRISLTRIKLSQGEIKDVINYYAEKAMIPVIGGILKAAVDDIIISAVDSGFAGSRFIINKITPYSLIE